MNKTKKTIMIITVVIFTLILSSNLFAKRLIIAVEKFKNLTTKTEYNWFGEAIASTITSDLQNIPSITVIDRKNIEKAFKELEIGSSDFTDSNYQLKLGKMLAANTIVVGEYQVFGKKIQITAKFMDVETTKIIKSTKLYGNIDDFFELQSKIVFNLINNINEYRIKNKQKEMSITTDIKKKIKAKPTKKMTALEYYTKATEDGYKAEYKTAIKNCKKAIEIDKNYVEALNYLSYLYILTAKYDEAKVLLHNTQKLISDKNSINYSDTLYYLGWIHDNQGYQDEALEYYLKALEIEEKILGKNHTSTANTYNNIGLVYKNKGYSDKALEYYQKALNIYENEMGKEHPSVANINSNIGLVYKKNKNYKNALKYYLRALNIEEKSLGKEHPNTAISYNNIGILYYIQKNYDKALEFYFKALIIRESKLGKEHPDTASLYYNIGETYNQQGKYKKALEYLHKELMVCEKRLGKEHPDTKISYRNIAVIYSKIGDEKAAKKYEKLGKK